MTIERETLSIQSVAESARGGLKLVLSDGRKLTLSVKSWNQLELSQGKDIGPAELLQLESESLYTEVRQKALALLAQREHSHEELKRKLRTRFPDRAAHIKRCLKEMHSLQYQSDERFARLFIESRLNNRRKGPYLILADLQQRGISREIAQPLLKEQTDCEFWLNRIRDNLEDLCKTGKKNKRSALGQKLFQRGFSHDLIEIVLSENGIGEY